MPEKTEKKQAWNTLRIEAPVMNLLYREQVRLRGLEGRKASYSEILRRMWDVYRAQIHAPPARTAPPESGVESAHQRWHELLDRILLNAEDDDRLAITNMLEVFARFINKDGDDAPKR